MATERGVIATGRYKDLPIVDLTWLEYLDGIRKADIAWRDACNGEQSVLGEGCSWERAIYTGHAVVLMPNWERLQPLEADVLIGAGERDPAFMFLGNNKAAGWARHIFRGEDTLAERTGIHRLLSSLQEVASNEFPRAGEEVYRRLIAMDRIGVGVATRLITLARPDCGISVNSASRQGLAQISGLGKTTLHRPERYRELLEWVAEQPWHRSSPPEDPREREIWEIRAALLDCRVYAPKIRDKNEEARPRGRPRLRPAESAMKVPPVDLVGDMAEAFATITREIASFLEKNLPQVGGQNWWGEYVVNVLTIKQQDKLKEHDVQTLGGLDLAALLIVLDRNWFKFRDRKGLSRDSYNYLKEMQTIRNHWAHGSANGANFDDAHRYLDTIFRLLTAIRASEESVRKIATVRTAVRSYL